MAFKFKNTFSKSSQQDSNQKHKDGHELLPVSLYIKIFLILLCMIFVNIGISRLPLPSQVVTGLLITVAIIQTFLVGLFFMELIHENKFYSFIFGSAILFMLLFFTITLLELSGRGLFDRHEDIRYMRQIDKNGEYAPGGPEMKQSEQEKK